MNETDTTDYEAITPVKVYGNLSVLRRVKGQQVLARCACGNFVTAALYALERGWKKSCGRCHADAEVAARFWATVDKSGGPDACWPWMGKCRTKDGYGIFRLGHAWTHAHRIAWELHNKKLIEHCDEYMEVRHLCGKGMVNGCCNPAHLELGTHVENMADMVKAGRAAKGERHGRNAEPAAYEHLEGEGHWRHQPGYEGRAATGERHGMAKITREQAIDVRRLYETDMSLTQEEIGKRVGLTQAHVSDIVSGKVWMELNDGGPSPREKRIQQIKARDENVLKDVQAGTMSYGEIAKKYGFSVNVIYRVMGKDYKHKRYRAEKPSEAPADVPASTPPETKPTSS